MKTKARGLGTAAALLSLFVGSACMSAEAGDVERGSEDRPFSRVINVETWTIERTRFEDRIELTGSIEASRDVVVAAEEGGVVRELFADKGDRLRQGDPIVKIDDAILRSRVEEARARAELARETWTRRKRLYDEDQVGSELAYLEARYAWQEAAAVLATLEERLERTTVRAPYSGVLDERTVEVGSMLAPGAPVGRLLDVDPVKVVAGVPERYAGDVHTGTPVEVTFDVLPGEVFEGTITYAGTAVRERDRTFPIELPLDNTGRAIKPRMVATLSVIKRVVEDAVVVPREALVRVESGFVAFVVEEEDGEAVVRRRDVTTGPSHDDEVLVQDGLEAGERLVVVGQQTVTGGDRVRVVAER